MDEQAEYNIPYFRNLWQTNMNDLQKQCDVWGKICMDYSVPDEVLGDIRTNIGLAKLLMNQKLKQFKGLIDDSEFKTAEKEITCLDLQGFWDMVYNEVEKIMKCFLTLEKCKNNEWKFDDVDSEKRPKKKVHVKRDFKALSEKDDSSKSRALAARQRLAEAKKKMLALHKQKQQNFVEITVPDEEIVNQTNILNSDNNGRFSNTTESANKGMIKVSIENLKQDLHANGEQMSSIKTSQKVETIVLNKESKYKASLQKNLTPSIQNKENFVPDDGGSNIKSYSKTQTKSKEKSEVPSTKKRAKSKDYELQRVTRSATRALIAQQNLIKK